MRMNSTINLLISAKKGSQDFKRDYDSLDQFGEYCHLNNTEPSNPWRWDVFPFLKFLQWYSEDFGVFKPCTSFVILFYSFWCYRNKIAFLIQGNTQIMRIEYSHIGLEPLQKRVQRAPQPLLPREGTAGRCQLWARKRAFAWRWRWWHLDLRPPSLRNNEQ